MAKAIYNYRHQQARAKALKELQDGTPCHLCGQPMYKSQQLHLDHNPGGHGYRGLAHAHCNVVDGASRGGIATASKWHPERTQTPKQPFCASRNW